MPKIVPHLPLPVSRALKQLGANIRDARRRRRIKTAVMADRMFISRPTLRRLENGDPTVAIGTFATALYVLGVIKHLEDLASITIDSVGQQLSSDNLPKRIR